MAGLTVSQAQLKVCKLQARNIYEEGSVWDGDLLSKTARDDLVKQGHVHKYNGYNVLTPAGVEWVRNVYAELD